MRNAKIAKGSVEVPEWATEIQSIVLGITGVPEGWKTSGEIAAELGLGMTKTRGILAGIRASDGDQRLHRHFKVNSNRTLYYDWEAIKKEAGV